MSDLQAYLAAKYMTGAKADAILDRNALETTGKKRKKRRIDSNPTASSSQAGAGAGGSGMRISSGIVIEDNDDESSWKAKGGRGTGEDEEEDSAPSSFSLSTAPLSCTDECILIDHILYMFVHTRAFSRRTARWSL